MSCNCRNVEEIKKAAEKFAKFHKNIVVVVMRAGRCSFYEPKYLRETDEEVCMYDFTPKKKVKKAEDVQDI